MFKHTDTIKRCVVARARTQLKARASAERERPTAAMPERERQTIRSAERSHRTCSCTRTEVSSPQELRDVGRRTQSCRWLRCSALSEASSCSPRPWARHTSATMHLWHHQSPRAAAVPPSRGAPARAAEEEKSPNSCPAAASAAPRPLSNGSDDPRDRGAIRWMFDFFLLGVYSPLVSLSPYSPRLGCVGVVFKFTHDTDCDAHVVMLHAGTQ